MFLQASSLVWSRLNAFAALLGLHGCSVGDCQICLLVVIVNGDASVSEELPDALFEDWNSH